LRQRGEDKQDNPFTGQTPSVGDIQGLFDISENKKGKKVQQVEVIN